MKTVKRLSAPMFVLVCVAGLSTACSQGKSVSAWVSSTTLTSDISTIRTDAANVVRVEKTHNPGAIRTDCAVLDLDTENANQNLPTPNQQLTDELSDAYTAEIQAAQDCFHGAGKSNELLSRGQIAQSAAYEDIDQAVALANQLSH